MSSVGAAPAMRGAIRFFSASYLSREGTAGTGPAFGSKSWLNRVEYRRFTRSEV